LRQILRESRLPDVARRYLRRHVERRMYARLLTGRSEYSSAARVLRESYGGTPWQKKKQQEQQQQQQ
jgi:hypothetical protein